jgi:hypothetical protein
VSYFFHPAAAVEYLESVAYFESKRAGLGALYLSEFEQLLQIVCKSPHRYPIEKQPNIHRVQMRRFPFTIFYREVSGFIQVLAVAHHRRLPLYWLGRL